jgi:uncharacterized protein YbbC (DUF1343 family)
MESTRWMFSVLILTSLLAPVVIAEEIPPLSAEEIDEAFSQNEAPEKVAVLSGLDVMVLEDFKPFWGKTVGLVTNHTAIARDGRHLSRLIEEHPKIKLGALFGPEHGVWGQEEAGKKIEHATGDHMPVPVYSLYGKDRKPTAEMLQGLDLLIYDIQDVGVRFYTRITTMGLCMEAAAEHGLAFYVLDRPNPIGGEKIEGPIPDPDLKSFVSYYPIPIRYGLTPGELAKMIIGEQWLEIPRPVQLRVIEMKGWRRNLWYDQIDLPWVAPSPNMPDLQTAAFYPGMCFFEGTNLSEGRGTDFPFRQVGAPWIDGASWAWRMNKKKLPGMHFAPAYFKTKTIPGKVTRPRFEGQRCEGVLLQCNSLKSFDPVRTALYLMADLGSHYPEQFEINNYFTTLVGRKDVADVIRQGGNPDGFILKWRRELSEFEKKRRKYFLY